MCAADQAIYICSTSPCTLSPTSGYMTGCSHSRKDNGVLYVNRFECSAVITFSTLMGRHSLLVHASQNTVPHATVLAPHQLWLAPSYVSVATMLVYLCRIRAPHR
jgi:hypothetical protein